MGRATPSNRPTSGRKELRCAIYTRKSSEEGLEQSFNSLEAQREACENYVKSQAHEGWVLIPDHFDDGGFSGGNIDRPGLKQLMGLVDRGEVDIIVVYKIDRLTRSLMDFAKLAEEFEKHDVSFVSITQSLNTKDSMGRLMLNVLLSFAQFERELTGERIRDKFAASKNRGMFMGGPVPLGYDLKDRQLIVNPAEAETVRKIFDLYLELGIVRLVEEELRRLGLRTKSYIARSGKQMGGQPFARGHLYKILGNPLYVGDISHKGERHKGLHDAIVDTVIWDRVQAMLGDNTQGKRQRANAKESSLLAGLLVDEFGNKLTATHAVKGGRRYRYYTSKPSVARGKHNQPVSGYRIPASEIEPVVLREIIELLRDANRLTDALALGQSKPDLINRMHTGGSRFASTLETALPGVQRDLIEQIVDEVALTEAGFEIHLNRRALCEELLGEAPSDEDAQDVATVAIKVSAQLTRHGMANRLVVEGQAPLASGVSDEPLIRAIACGRAWFEELSSGRASSFGEIAKRVGVTDRYVSRIVDLAFLAPELVEAMLAGEGLGDVSVKSLTVERILPADWASQKGVI
jgi:DNA invertase Pin-like site-specific DNA recombinase